MPPPQHHFVSQPLPQLVTNWLYNVIQPLYKHKEIVYQHVYQFLQAHLKKNLDFRIRTKVYTSEKTGRPDLLINLFGTIIVNDVIGVPIEIWVPFTYPYGEEDGAPFVYIVPEHSKLWFLRANNNVDSQGRFYHPYLSNWHNRGYSGDNTSSTPSLLNLLDTVIYPSILEDPPITNLPPTTFASQENYQTCSLPPLPPKPPKLPKLPELPELTRPINLTKVSHNNGEFNQSFGDPNLLQFAASSLSAGSSPSRLTSPLPALSSPSIIRQSTGPPLPAKPPKVISPTTASPQIMSPQFSGINGAKYPIPSRYLAPLPPPQSPPLHIINNINDNNYNSSINNNNNININNDTHIKQYIDMDTTLHLQQLHYPLKSSNNRNDSHVSEMMQHLSIENQRTGLLLMRQINASEIDIIDDVEQSTKVNDERKASLERLSTLINDCFQNEPLLKDIAYANENVRRANALATQLHHHYLQAIENSKNLDGHIDYLSAQLASLQSLNAELTELNQRNNTLETSVCVKPGIEIPLDDIIIPDLVLVKQLYDVVLEIKSIKDTMNLMSGNFHGCGEIINDKNMDACVKSMRNLGRDLFWLELTKNEIANIMKLQK